MWCGVVWCVLVNLTEDEPHDPTERAGPMTRSAVTGGGDGCVVLGLLLQ